MSAQPNEWASLPCGVPGYDLTLGAYAKLIQDCIAKGDFRLGKYYLDAYTSFYGEESLYRLTLTCIET